MPDEKLSQLTAEEFYKEWARDPTYYPDHYNEWLEFAEAYATECKQYQYRCFELIREKDENLLRRAAELLRPMTIQDHEWFQKRDQWLRDAGVEGK
jgi:hypothetical protein